MPRRRFLSVETLEPRRVLSANATCIPCRVDVFLAETSDNQLSTANDLGILDGGAAAKGEVGLFDRQDFYRFQLAEESNVDVQLAGAARDVDLFLYDRFGQRIGDSLTAGAAQERIAGPLEMGEYFVQVRGYRHAGTSYDLTLQATSLNKPPLDAAGNTPLAARKVTDLLSRPTFHDSITTADPLDYYEVEIQQLGEVRFELGHHEQGLDLYVISATGEMVGKGIAGAAGARPQAEALSTELTPGTYYAVVLPTQGTVSPYDLTIAAVQSVPRRFFASQGARLMDRLAGSGVPLQESKDADREAMAAAIAAVTEAEPAFPWTPPETESSMGRPLAFPGAEGLGAYAQGGRGGDLYVVENLNDNGKGSLRYGIESATGPRTIEFAVSGEINLQSRLYIKKPFLTITGQKAPGEGITITGQTVVLQDTHDIIMRYVRIRPGDEDPYNPRTHDALTIIDSEDIMIDHVSLSWAIDELFNTARVENVTVQWSILSEPLEHSSHPSGLHGYAVLADRSSISLHHNLIAHGSFRMPRINDGSVFEMSNNIIYDWSSSMPTSVGKDVAGNQLSEGNIENNVYIAGPSIGDFDPYEVFWAKDASQIYFAGNVVDGDLNGHFKPSGDIHFRPDDQAVYVKQRFEYSSLQVEPVHLAYESVLSRAGASEVRDATDTRVVSEVIHQTGSTIDSPSDVNA